VECRELCRCFHHTVHVNMTLLAQGSHASWKVLKSSGIFFVKFPGPRKSWKWFWYWKVLEI